MCNRSRRAEVELTRFDHIQVHFVSKMFVFRFDAARGAEATFCCSVFYIFNHSSIPVLREYCALSLPNPNNIPVRWKLIWLFWYFSVKFKGFKLRWEEFLPTLFCKTPVSDQFSRVLIQGFILFFVSNSRPSDWLNRFSAETSLRFLDIKYLLNKLCRCNVNTITWHQRLQKDWHVYFYLKRQGDLFSSPLSELLLQVSYDCKAHKSVFSKGFNFSLHQQHYVW